MVGARAAVLVVPAAIYLFSNVHRVAPGVVATDLMKAFLDATWAGLEAGGVRIYPEAGYRTAFGVCLALAAGSLVMTLLVTETCCRNIWRRATH